MSQTGAAPERRRITSPPLCWLPNCFPKPATTVKRERGLTLGFKKLRRRLAQRIERVVRTDVETVAAVRATMPNGQRFSFDEFIGPALADREKLHVSKAGNNLHFPPDAITLIQEAADDALRQAEIAARVSDQRVFSIMAFSVAGNFEELRAATVTPATVADLIVDELEGIDESFTLFTPLLGCVPENGPFTVGGVRIYRSGRRFIDEVYRPGVASLAAKHNAPAARNQKFEEKHLREYELHSVAEMKCVGEMGRAMEKARDKMDLVLGALRLFTVLSPLEADQFQFRAFGEAWNFAPHHLQRWEVDKTMAPNYGINIPDKPIALDTARIPVTKLPQFQLIDRVIGADNPNLDLSPLERRLRQFVYWFGLAQDSSRNTETFIKLFVSLETLFDCPEVSKSQKMDFPALYWAWVEQDRAEGQRLRDELAALYAHRGKMVHEGVFDVTPEQIRQLYFGTVMGFLLFTDLLTNLNLKTTAELRDWYQDQRSQLDEPLTDP